MIEALIPLTLGLSLTHPQIFGFAWYLLVMLCIGMSVRAWSFGSKSVPNQPRDLSSGISSRSAWKIWLLAFGPLTIISLISVLANNLRFGRAEVVELFLGGLVFAIAFNSEHLKIKQVALLIAATLAGYFGLLLTIYESVLLNISRVGNNFNQINYGISCGSALLILVLWAVLQDKRSSSLTPSDQAWSWWNNSWILGVAVFGSGFALLQSGSRGPIIALILSIIAALSNSKFRRELMSLNKSAKFGLAISVAIFLVGIVFAIYPRFMDTLHLTTQSSDGIRWQLILIAIEQIKQSPWLGIGADQAGNLYATFPAPISDFNHAHVTLLNLALELGLLGALSWIWAFGVLALVFSPWKFSNHSSISIMGFLVCAYLFACSMTQDVMSHSYTRKYFALIIPLLLSIHLANRQKHA